MHIEIRVGNKGFVDIPFIELGPGEVCAFRDEGEDSKKDSSPRILLVQCNSETPDGMMMILPGDVILTREMIEGEMPDAITKESTIHVINGEPEVVTINNPKRGFNSARAIIRYIQER